MTTLRYEDHNIKVYENEKRILEKSNELDTIKIIQKLIETYNQNKNFHYFLRLKFGVRRAWF